MYNGTQTALLYVGPVAILWIILTIIAAYYGSTRAPPASTVILLACLWLFIGLPLTLVGSAMAHRWSKLAV